MGTIRFKRSGSGGMSFKRVHRVFWDDPTDLATTEDVLGKDGITERAIVFGFPSSVGSSGDIRLDETIFLNQKEAGRRDFLTVPPGSKGRIVVGPFFKGNNAPEEQLAVFAKTGAWVPTLTDSDELTLSLGDLVEDCNYEIRLVVPNAMKVLTGRFIAHAERAEFKVPSLVPGKPPAISSYVLRRTGFSPKTFARILLPGKDVREADPQLGREDLEELVEE